MAPSLEVIRLHLPLGVVEEIPLLLVLLHSLLDVVSRLERGVRGLLLLVHFKFKL